MSIICPICQSTEFDDFSGRIKARCMKCGSLERGRLAWLVIERLGLVKPGTRLLNCAPEPFMLFFAAPIIGETYVATDYFPEKFAKYNKTVKKLDLSGSLSEIEGMKFDVIMHNHVLEHLPCAVKDVLVNLNEKLAPGGYHVFSAPILPNRKTEEDLDPNLSAAERLRRFGQDDHMRVFGALDFMSILESAGMAEGLLDVTTLVSPNELAGHSIPEGTLDSLNGHRVFVYRNDGGRAQRA